MSEFKPRELFESIEEAEAFIHFNDHVLCVIHHDQDKKCTSEKEACGRCRITLWRKLGLIKKSELQKAKEKFYNDRSTVISANAISYIELLEKASAK